LVELRGHVDTEKRKIFGASYYFDDRIDPANLAIDFFTAQCSAARKAVDAWCLLAVRINNKVNRDIRKKIGMIIWEAREQADYKEEKKSARALRAEKRARIEISD